MTALQIVSLVGGVLVIVLSFRANSTQDGTATGAKLTIGQTLERTAHDGLVALALSIIANAFEFTELSIGFLAFAAVWALFGARRAIARRHGETLPPRPAPLR